MVDRAERRMICLIMEMGNILFLFIFSLLLLAGRFRLAFFISSLFLAVSGATSNRHRCSKGCCCIHIINNELFYYCSLVEVLRWNGRPFVDKSHIHAPACIYSTLLVFDWGF